jgi:Mg2+/citrate symporter
MQLNGVFRNFESAAMLRFVGKYFNVLLTVHISTTLVNDQLDAQLLYFIISLLQFCTCFEQRRAHHQEVKLIQHLV